ncbi:MAG: hypothetical protein ABIO24_06950 [Saprospiraceae bacterium]
MNLEKYLVVAGVPGVHKLISSRANGLVIEDRNEGRTRFVPVRQQQVTPIATVAIYTDTEEGTISLTDVFQKMLDQYETLPPADINANSAALREYFTGVLPEHDRDRVHINDIKKCIKWFNFMQEKGIFAEAQREAEKEAALEKENSVETAVENAPEPPVETTPEPPVEAAPKPVKPKTAKKLKA